MACTTNQPLGSTNLNAFYLTNVKFKVVMFEPIWLAFLNTPFRDWIGLVWINFPTFNFNCCKLINSPTFCIANVQVIMVTSSSSMNNPPNPFFDSLFTYSNDLKMKILICSNAYLFFLAWSFPFSMHPSFLSKPYLFTSFFH